MHSRPVWLAFILATVLTPASALAIASAELYSTKAYYYGRFDARVRFAPGDGVISSFFLWKEGSDAANAYWNELDLEKFGAGCSLQTNAYYGKPATQHQQKPSVSVDMCGGYHDYRFEWTPTYIAWIIDGKEIRRDTGDNANAFAQNASAGMTFHFNIWPGNSDFGGNINNTTLPVRQYISWVQYSSYDNGNFTVQWREEFQSSGVPSGWAVGDWQSPFKLSTHNPQNVAFVDGIAVLSLTADNGTGNPGTPPVDPAATGSGGSGGGSGGAAGTGGAPGAGGKTASAGGSSGSGSTGGAPGAGGTTSGGGSTPPSGAGGSSATSGAGGARASGGASGSAGSAGAGAGGAAGVAAASGGSGGPTASGGNAGSAGSVVGGAPGAGGTTSASGAAGASSSGGTPASGGNAQGSTPGTATSDGGCNCRTGPAASPLGPALIVLFLLALRLRRRET